MIITRVAQPLITVVCRCRECGRTFIRVREMACQEDQPNGTGYWDDLQCPECIQAENFQRWAEAQRETEELRAAGFDV